jgi:hypothetical protein
MEQKKIEVKGNSKDFGPSNTLSVANNGDCKD